MKRFFIQSLSLCLMAFIAFSCGGDDPTPSGLYAEGVFIINEGNFGDGDGSVSFYNRETEEVEQTLFQLVNDNEPLGDVIQSAHLSNGLLYLVANNSNKIEVVNASTFKSVFTISSNINLPRYAAVSGSKLYVTEWVSLDDSFIPTGGNLVIFNAETGAFIEKIALSNGSEQIEIVNNKAFVTNTTGSLSIVDLSDNSVTNVSLSTGPGGIVKDLNGDVWVACGGGFNPDFSLTNDGAFYRIDTDSNEIKETVELEKNFSSKIDINNAGNSIYYSEGNQVFVLDVLNPTVAASALFSVESTFSFYGMGIDKKTDNIFLSDAKDFVQDGEVYVYSSEGVNVNTFSVGRIPNGFVFN